MTECTIHRRVWCIFNFLDGVTLHKMRRAKSTLNLSLHRAYLFGRK
jgi:hypothetical protein